MSELQNPLFDEEKEFLERKKLEYERALRGDVEHIKDQSVMVGKVALVGAGLAGGIWLITKAFGGKKRKRKAEKTADDKKNGYSEEADHDYEFGTGYFSSGKPHKDDEAPKSAAESAKIFTEQYEQTHEAEDLGFGSTSAKPASQPEAADFEEDTFEEDPFQDLPYDDSRRLPASHAFDEQDPLPIASKPNSTARMVGAVLQSFLQSDTGKVLVGQVAAVALALVTKKVGEFFPADKNSDLAASPDPATAETGASLVASSAPSVPSDASNPPQSL
jgi:hypothetical protein